MQGGFEYPEGENWSTTEETQKLSGTPKNYFNTIQTPSPGIQDPIGLATSFILSPLTPFHIPTSIIPMLCLCSFWFLYLK